jgi:protein disulfide-isomerase A6
MSRFLIVAALVVAVLATAATAMYDAKDDVAILTDENFEKKVLDSKRVWLVEFYAPWCGHCKQMTPAWKKAATALKGIAKLGAVDATEAKGLGEKYKVEGFPTIKVFGADKKQPTEFEGGRAVKDIIDGAFAEAAKVADARLK